MLMFRKFGLVLALGVAASAITVIDVKAQAYSERTSIMSTDPITLAATKKKRSAQLTARQFRSKVYGRSLRVLRQLRSGCSSMGNESPGWTCSLQGQSCCCYHGFEGSFCMGWPPK
jgi:hypothetical protein